jgi:hypothetical protein
MIMPVPRVFVVAIVLALMSLSTGCAWRQKNAYAYAPPYAPPVYPQPGLPQQSVPVQPVAYPAAPVQSTSIPGAIVPTAPVVSPSMPPQVVVPTVGTNPFSQTCDPCMGTNVVTPVLYEGAVQTQPCPPVQ